MTALYTGVQRRLAYLGAGKRENERCLHPITFDKVNHTFAATFVMNNQSHFT